MQKNEKKVEMIFGVIMALLIIFEACVFAAFGLEHGKSRRNVEHERTKFSSELFIGKSADEIQSEYGKFDKYYREWSENKYTDTGFYYIYQKEYSYDIYLNVYYRISFDENGIAYKCSEEFVGDI